MRKIIGCILVVLSGLLFSLQWILRQKAKLENLKEMQKALFLMKQEISFSGAVLAEITNSIGLRVNGDVGRFFREMSEILSLNETASLLDCYQKAQDTKPLLSLQAERTLEDFFASAGTFSKSVEEVHIDRTITRLVALEQEATETLMKEKKFSVTLGLCASFSVVMILI